MPEFRIKEKTTTRVMDGPWVTDCDPDDYGACADLLRIRCESRNVRHPDGVLLQVWDPKRGWRDLNSQ